MAGQQGIPSLDTAIARVFRLRLTRVTKNYIYLLIDIFLSEEWIDAHRAIKQ